MKVFIGDYPSIENVKQGEGRDVQVELHGYDSWNCDTTLNYIIHPLMKQLRNESCSYSLVAKEDVPEHISPHSLEAWKWMLDEIIWATDNSIIDSENFFNEETGEWDVAREERFCNRREAAMKLFGKYYYSFWD